MRAASSASILSSSRAFEHATAGIPVSLAKVGYSQGAKTVSNWAAHEIHLSSHVRRDSKMTRIIFPNPMPKQHVLVGPDPA